MELDEMKNLWEDLSGKVESQQKLNKEQLLEMTKKSYQNSLGKIYLPEILGSIICFLYAGFFIFQIGKLEFPVNQILAVFNTAAMIVLPVISLVTLYRLNRLVLKEDTPAHLLKRFMAHKTFFWKFQRLNLILSGVFAITILPPLAELVGKVDLIMESKFWMVYVPIGLIFIYIFGRWAFRKYDKALLDTQQLIEGID
jgi:hypothetical protein